MVIRHSIECFGFLPPTNQPRSSRSVLTLVLACKQTGTPRATGPPLHYLIGAQHTFTFVRIHRQISGWIKDFIRCMNKLNSYERTFQINVNASAAFLEAAQIFLNLVVQTIFNTTAGPVSVPLHEPVQRPQILLSGARQRASPP